VTPSIHTCPACGSNNSTVLKDTALLTCKNCPAIVYQHSSLEQQIPVARIPADWSFLQKGTSGVYKENTFTLVGRVRLQLRNDYKNLWCAYTKSGEYFWLMESFASFAAFQPVWQRYSNDVRTLHAGKSIKIQKDVSVKGEYVEKCEAISYDGEIGNWKLFSPGFFFIQASNNAGETAIYMVGGKNPIEFLAGEKVPVEKLQLKNILAWNEWK
jgi:hypothetical protein